MDGDPTVFIVDDDPAARQELVAMVKAGGCRVETYKSAERLLDRGEVWPPGCILADFETAGGKDPDLLKRLAAEDVRPPVVFLSADPVPRKVVRALRAGALNFLEKPCQMADLREAVREALALDAENRREHARRARLQRREAGLTPGEREVLDQMLAGRLNREIAVELGLSVRAVEVRRAKLMKKMRARSVAELVRMALAAAEPSEGSGETG